MDVPTTLAILSFILFLGLLIFMRSKNSSLEVKSADVIVALVPVLVILLATGKLQKIVIGEGGVTIETVFKNASQAPIETQVNAISGLPISTPRTGEKSRASNIPGLLESKTEALIFRLGTGKYAGKIVKQYIYTLIEQPYLKHIVIENLDKTFFAILDARKLATLFKSKDVSVTPDLFAQWINNNEKQEISKLPGFISFENALSPKSDKAKALWLMEEKNADALPVLNQQQQLVGIVDRSRLTASLLVDISQEMHK